MNADRPAPSRTYVSAPHLRWVNDGDMTLLVDPRSCRSHRLYGVEAAAWRSFAAACPVSQVVAHLSGWRGIDRTAAHELLCTMLADWAALSLLEIAEGSDG